MPSPRGSTKFSEARQTRRVRRALIYRTDVCQLTLGETEGGGVELNKNKGVSSQKVAYLCSNSLTLSMGQRPGLLMGREQIGGRHLRFSQGEGGGPPYCSGARRSPRAPGSDIDLASEPQFPPLENKAVLSSKCRGAWTRPARCSAHGGCCCFLGMAPSHQPGRHRAGIALCKGFTPGAGAPRRGGLKDIRALGSFGGRFPGLCESGVQHRPFCTTPQILGDAV